MSLVDETSITLLTPIKNERVKMNTICSISGGVADLVVQKFGSYLLQVFSKDMKPIKMHVVELTRPYRTALNTHHTHCLTPAAQV